MKIYLLLAVGLLNCTIKYRNQLAYYPFNQERGFINLSLPKNPKNMDYLVEFNLMIPENPKEREISGIEIDSLEKNYPLNPELSYWKREFDINLKSKNEFPSGTFKIPVPTGKNNYQILIELKNEFKIEKKFTGRFKPNQIVKLEIKDKGLYVEE